MSPSHGRAERQPVELRRQLGLRDARDLDKNLALSLPRIGVGIDNANLLMGVARVLFEILPLPFAVVGRLTISSTSPMTNAPRGKNASKLTGFADLIDTCLCYLVS